jgi:hypothetical protein
MVSPNIPAVDVEARGVRARGAGARSDCLEPAYVQRAGLQVDLIATKGDELRDAEPVAIGEHDERRITVPMSAD